MVTLVPRSKLTPPAFPGHVVRTDLVSKLQSGQSAHKLVFLAAPAGWGKSVLLSQVHDHCARRADGTTCWLSLDRQDAEPAIFLRNLLQAISSAGLEYNREQAAAQLDRGKAASCSDLAAVLSETIHGSRTNLAAFIDNAQFILGREQVGVLKSLLQRCPNLRLFLASRRPSDNLCATFAIRGQALVAGPADLNFSDAEIERITASVRPTSLMADMIKSLDGWPIAVTHAVDMLTSRQVYAPMEAMTRYRGNLAVFVRAEIVSELEPVLQCLYYRLCFLQRFVRDTVTSLFDERDIHVNLAKLQNDHGLIQADPRRNGWICVPAALRSIARESANPVTLPEQRAIHRRAFAWFLRHEFIPEAIAHIEHGDEPGQFQELLRHEVLIAVLLREGPAVIDRVLRHLPPETISQNRILAVTNALGKLRHNDIESCQEWLEVAKRGLMSQERLQLTVKDDECTDTAIQVYVTEMIINAYLDRLDALRERPVLDWIVDLKWTRARKFKGIAYGLQSLLQLFEGDIRGSEESCRKGLQSFSAFGGQSLSELYCFVAGSLNALVQGDPGKADWYHQQALTKIPKVEIEDLGLSAILHLLEFEIQHDHGNMADANVILEVLQEAEKNEYFADVFIRGYALACQSAFLKDGFDAAEVVIAKANRSASRLNLPRLRCRVNYLKAGYLTICGDVESATKELRSPGSGGLDAGFWYEAFCRALTEARLEVANDRLLEASRQLHELQQTVDRDTQVRCAMMLDLVTVQWLCAKNKTAEMCELLKTVLLQAEYSMLRGPLFEEGLCLLRPLRVLMSRHGKDPVLRKAKPLIDRLLCELEKSEFQILLESGPGNALTDQERRVFYFIKQGMRNKVVAHELNLAEATVKYHLRNIYRKLGVTNRMQALAVTEGILDLDADCDEKEGS